jgi:hypothetical protein
MTSDIDHRHLPGRAVLIAQRLVELVGTLGEESDSVRLADRLVVDCLDLVGVDAVAVLLADPDGAVAASSDSVERMMESAKGRGLEESSGEFLLGHGFSVLYTFPLRNRVHSVGTLYLFLADRPPLTASDLDVAQVLADAAAVTLVHLRRLSSAVARAEQLQGALDSRISVERATGVLAEYAGIGMGAAFDALRGYARSNRLKLSLVAEQVVARRLDPGQVVPARLRR